MIVRVRFNDLSSQSKPNWILYSVSAHIWFSSLFHRIYCQDIEPKVDLSWSDPESCKVFTAVTRKDRPENDDLQETSGLITLDDIYEKEHRLFVHFDLENMKSTSSKNTNMSFTCDNATIYDAEPSLDIVSTNSSPSQSAQKSIFGGLMKAQNHYPRVKSGVKLRRDVQQYNSIISFITASGLGVAGTNLSEYE